VPYLSAYRDEQLIISAIQIDFFVFYYILKYTLKSCVLRSRLKTAVPITCRTSDDREFQTVGPAGTENARSLNLVKPNSITLAGSELTNVVVDEMMRR